jgi:hypothetical protein
MQYTDDEASHAEDIADARHCLAVGNAGLARSAKTRYPAAELPELLLAQKHSSLCSLLMSNVSVMNRFIILCAIGESNGALTLLQRHLRREKELSFVPAAWFYMTSDLGDNTAFWDLLRRSARNIANVSLPSCWSGEATSLPKGAHFRDYRLSRRAVAAIFTMHLARTANDLSLLRRVRREYPRWNEPSVLLQDRNRNGRFATWRELQRLRGDSVRRA